MNGTAVVQLTPQVKPEVSLPEYCSQKLEEFANWIHDLVIRILQHCIVCLLCTFDREDFFSSLQHKAPDSVDQVAQAILYQKLERPVPFQPREMVRIEPYQQHLMNRQMPENELLMGFFPHPPLPPQVADHALRQQEVQDPPLLLPAQQPEDAIPLEQLAPIQPQQANEEFVLVEREEDLPVVHDQVAVEQHQVADLPEQEVQEQPPLLPEQQDPVQPQQANEEFVLVEQQEDPPVAHDQVAVEQHQEAHVALQQQEVELLQQEEQELPALPPEQQEPIHLQQRDEEFVLVERQEELLAVHDQELAEHHHEVVLPPELQQPVEQEEGLPVMLHQGIGEQHQEAQELPLLPPDHHHEEALPLEPQQPVQQQAIELPPVMLDQVAEEQQQVANIGLPEQALEPPQQEAQELPLLHPDQQHEVVLPLEPQQPVQQRQAIELPPVMLDQLAEEQHEVANVALQRQEVELLQQEAQELPQPPVQQPEGVIPHEQQEPLQQQQAIEREGGPPVMHPVLAGRQHVVELQHQQRVYENPFLFLQPQQPPQRETLHLVLRLRNQRLAPPHQEPQQPIHPQQVNEEPPIMYNPALLEPGQMGIVPPLLRVQLPERDQEELQPPS